MNPNLELLLQLEELVLLARGLKLVRRPIEGSSAHRLEEKIDKLRRRLPGRVVSVYDRLARQFPDAVTVIADGICQGCQHTVAGRLAAQVSRANGIVQCDQCGRFIVAKENAPDHVSRNLRGDRSSLRMTLDRLTEPKLLIPRVLSDRQEGVIRELTKRLESTGRIENVPAFLDAVLKREAELPTFMDGVALPHARGGLVQTLSLAIGVSEEGIPWDGDDRHIVHIVFLLAVPLSETQTYLSLLSGLSRLMRDEQAFTALNEAAQPEEMLEVLRGVGMPDVRDLTDDDGEGCETKSAPCKV